MKQLLDNDLLTISQRDSAVKSFIPQTAAFTCANILVKLPKTLAPKWRKSLKNG